MQKSLQTIALPVGSLESYVHWANQIPMLTKDEEYDLATRWQEKQDLEAARQLVLAHLRFVAKVARGYGGYGLPQADLIQEGNVGLMKAVKRFDPKVGVRLVSFAVHWIKAEIHEFVLRNWRIVKIATTKAQRKAFFNLRSAKKRLGWFTRQEVNDVAKDLGIKTSVVEEMEARMNAYDMAFDAPDDDDGDGGKQSSAFSPMHYLEDKRADPAYLHEVSDWSNQSQQQLTEAMTKLDARSYDILQQRWLADKKSTLQDLATKYGITAERIRQLEQNALKKLKGAIVDRD